MSEQKPKESQEKKYIYLAIAAFLLIVAFLFGRSIDMSPESFAKENMPKVEKPSSIIQEEEPVIEIFDTDLLIGDTKNPYIKIIEYGSLTCPHCAQFHNNIGVQLKKKYANQKGVLFIYRDFPLDKFALKAAQLARCNSDKRKAFIDTLYQKQSKWARGSEEDILKNLSFIAKTGGIPEKKLQECWQDKSLMERVVSERSYGTKTFSIQFTPNIIINGHTMKSGSIYKEYMNRIDYLLKRKGLI